VTQGNLNQKQKVSCSVVNR